MRRNLAGFTLIELLLALALGALLMGAALGSAAVIGRRHGEAEQVARLRERANQALGLLEPEVQLAGYGGLSPMSGWTWPTIPEGARACGTLLAAAPVALRIDAGYSLACAAHGGAAAAQSDVLTTLRASASLASAAPGRMQVLTGRRSTAAQRVLVDGQLPPGLRLAEGLDELRELELQSFYVARDSDEAPGLPALRLKSLTAIDGRATVVDQELVAGIEMLCFETSTGAAEDAGLTFAHRAGSFTPENLPAAVRLKVLVRSERPWGAVRDQPFDCGDRHIAARDAFLRHVASQTLAVRHAAHGSR